MFRQLAAWNQQQPGPGTPTDRALAILALHPIQLQRYLEERWAARVAPGLAPALDVPQPLVGSEQASGLELQLPAVATDIYPIGAGGQLMPWAHLIYAYMAEQTRIVEIFRRVAVEALNGEHLGALTPASQQWLRNAETLIFSDLPAGHVARVASALRPDPAAVRRNAYWRMFGLDLLHQADDGRPYPYLKAAAANREFVRTLEDFLREVWRGIENFTNISGPKPTDDAAIATLAQNLQEMLTVRREGGTLSREELAAVATLDFLHLTILYDSPIVVDLSAEATSPEERLRKCGERVGVPAHPKSDAYFELAEELSILLLAIEAGQHSTAATVVPLYATGSVRERMMKVITQWSAVTGRDMKARKVTATERGTAPATSRNGGGAASRVPAP